MEEATPPSYHDATINSYPAHVIKTEPVGYFDGESSYATISSIIPGGLRLDKEKKFVKRLIIDFESFSCCPWDRVGLDPDCKNYVPEKLRV